jgi:prepilin-type N-terminal cleavage/methylation domain-containing protein
MKALHGMRIQDGFTLIELLVVISIIAILAAMLYPAIRDALIRSRMVDTLNNGRSIYQSILSAEMDHRNIMPQSSGSMKFATSTDYFRWMITNKVLDATFQIFGAYGLPPYPGIDPSRFASDNNAWCVAVDISDSSPGFTPVMFTRNLNISRLNDPLTSALTDEAPYGTRGVIVVTKDGSVVIRRANELQDYFNPAGTSNAVLRP